MVYDRVVLGRARRPAAPSVQRNSKKKICKDRDDGVDFNWPLEVSLDDAGKLGRLGALRQAFDRLVRER